MRPQRGYTRSHCATGLPIEELTITIKSGPLLSGIPGYDQVEGQTRLATRFIAPDVHCTTRCAPPGAQLLVSQFDSAL